MTMFDNKAAEFKKRISELEEKNESLNLDIVTERDRAIELIDKIGSLQDDFQKCRESLSAKNKELEKTKSLLRDQTEADILINALKAVGIIRDEKTCDYMAEHQRLDAQRSQLGSPALNAQFFGGLGHFHGF